LEKRRKVRGDDPKFKTNKGKIPSGWRKLHIDDKMWLWRVEWDVYLIAPNGDRHMIEVSDRGESWDRSEIIPSRVVAHIRRHILNKTEMAEGETLVVPPPEKHIIRF
jgi:hypothetical protein